MVLYHEILKSKYTLKVQCTSHTFYAWSLKYGSWIFLWMVLLKHQDIFKFIVGFIRDRCLVHNIGCKTLIVKRTFISDSAIASKIFFAGIQNLFVVWWYNRFHVSHTTVTYFNRITVEYFVHRMSLWEVTL